MAVYTYQCAECGASFHASRPDAETCSGRCRRRRAEARVVAEVERATDALASLRAMAAHAPDD